ncbi:hypothetical protein N7533_012524 [Penicillium manginii]|uniref:uncharacterized protein n=1 Tax=Penicillium manginii TaxID=203109 RepID=UPI002547D09D|nr:uncharacterized protein N7533_012524 [Penicillium manginii]KAJ5739740.1 hypothetical protein N7533_012524 [Penicillium manginii]
MKIVIIGAGISGCAMYLELQKHLPKPSGAESHEIVIYEAYNTEADTTADQRPEGPTHSATLLVGGGLGIAANGLRILQRLDDSLLQDVVRGGYAVSSSNMKSKNGSLLMSLKPSVSPTADSPPMNMWLPDRMGEIRYSSRTLVPPVEADLVIGADGVRSTAKRALFPDATEDPYPPHYEGLVGVGGFIPASEVKDVVEKGSVNFIFGGNGFFGYFFSNSADDAPNRDSPYHICDPGDSLAWWSTYEIEECPDHKNIDKADVTTQLQKRHEGWKDPAIQKILGSLEVERMYPTWTSAPIPTWERDGVILVGDAAHALPPSSGQGSSQALEDVEALALILAHHLRNEVETSSGSYKTVFKAAAGQYMEIRQPHVSKILQAAQENQNKKREMGVFQEYMMYGFLKLVGFFPSLMTTRLRSVVEYNVVDHVAEILAKGD